MESSDDEQIIERVAALDIGKADVVCCVRLPSGVGQRRVQEVSTHSSMVPSLCELAAREAFAGLPLGTFDDHHRFLLARMLPASTP